MGDQHAAEKEIASARAIIDELAATVSDETLRASFYQGASRILKVA